MICLFESVHLCINTMYLKYLFSYFFSIFVFSMYHYTHFLMLFCIYFTYFVLYFIYDNFLLYDANLRITGLYFLPKTHLFFSGGRDFMVKEWDADNFQKIITLKVRIKTLCVILLLHYMNICKNVLNVKKGKTQFLRKKLFKYSIECEETAKYLIFSS